MRLGVHVEMYDNPWFDQFRQGMLRQLDQDWQFVTNFEDLSDFDAVAFLDCDDVPLQFFTKYMKSHISRHDVVACAMEVIDEHGSRIGKFGCPVNLDYYNVFGLGNTCYRVELLEKLMPFESDYELALKARDAGADMFFLDIPLVQYRRYGQDSSNLVKLDNGRYEWEV